MTDDQQRIGQLTAARLTVAGAFERWDTTPADERPAPLALAVWLLDKLQAEHGWRPPVTAEPVPPLLPEQPALDGPGRREFAEARAALAARRSHQRT